MLTDRTSEFELGLGARVLLGHVEEAGVGAGDHLDQDRGRLGHGLFLWKAGNLVTGEALSSAAGGLIGAYNQRGTAVCSIEPLSTACARRAADCRAGGWRCRRRSGESSPAGRSCAGWRPRHSWIALGTPGAAAGTCWHRPRKYGASWLRSPTLAVVMLGITPRSFQV